VSHCGPALPFTVKSILRQKKKNYGKNSNISPCKNILIFKKKKNPPLKETKILQDMHNS
jgi:hypothetical protein